MKNILFALGVIIIGLLIYIIVDPKFPIKLNVCTSTYGDCFVTAKFDDMRSCQDASEKGNWLCDSLTNPEKIECRPNHQSFAASYCSK